MTPPDAIKDIVTVAVPTAAAVFFLRPRPPLVPRRVFFFGLGASVPSPAGSSGDSSGSPRSGSGTWILATASGATSAGSPTPFPAAAGDAAVFFLRPRPPREPLRVFFFGASAENFVRTAPADLPKGYLERNRRPTLPESRVFVYENCRL